MPARMLRSRTELLIARDRDTIHVAVPPVGVALANQWSMLGADSAGVQTASRDIIAQLARRLVRRQSGPPGTMLAHRLIHLSHGKKASGHRHRRCGQSAVVAGAVESLVMQTGEGCGRTQRRRQAEDALTVMCVQANPLPLGGIQRPARDPDSVWDADHAEVMDLPGAPDRRHVVLIKSRIESCGFSQAGDSSRVPRREG